MPVQVPYSVVAVEGIIGAGKSTLCQRLERDLDLMSVAEPVEENPYLDKFYADQKKWALHMQMWLVSRRVSATLEAIESKGLRNGLLIDRSLLGDRVFAELHRKNGNIDEDTWPIYDDFFENMIRVVPAPRVVVYLNVTPGQALVHVAKRGRASEQSGVTLEYLQALKAKYDEMIGKITNAKSGWWKNTAVIDVKGYMQDVGVDNVVHMVADFIAHSRAKEQG